MTQRELFEQVMRLCSGNSAGTIKGALVNGILAILCQNSSNEDEAIVQWNELSLWIDKQIRERFASKILRPDDLGAIVPKLNGDTKNKL